MCPYDEFSYAFNELYNDITSLCMKNKPLKLKVSSLSKIQILKNKDEKSEMDEEIWKEKMRSCKYINDLNATILKFTNGKKSLKLLFGQQKQTLDKHVLGMLKIVKLYY